MTFKCDVVQATLPTTATVGSTVDFTITGFGTVAAAILISCNATTSLNPNIQSRMTIGFWDGTNARVAAFASTDGVSPSSVFKTSDDRYVLTYANPFGSQDKWTCANITDGIRITCSVHGGTNFGTKYVTAILFGGCSASVFTLTPGTTAGSTVTTPSLGFTPKCAFFTTVGSSVAQVDGSSTSASICFGFDAPSQVAYCDGIGDTQASNPSKANSFHSAGNSMISAWNDTINWETNVTTWGSDTFTVTTGLGNPGGALGFVLALGGTDLACEVDSFSSPTATQHAQTATSIAASAAIFVMTGNAGNGTLVTSTASGDVDACFSIGCVGANGQFCHATNIGDALATTDANSIAETAAALDVSKSSSGNSIVLKATATLNPTNVDLNYTTVSTGGFNWIGYQVVFAQAVADSNPMLGQACL